MKRYRILKNQDHYVVQKKGWFLWKYLEHTTFDKTPYFTYFSKSAYKFTNLYAAEQAVINSRSYDKTYRRITSKYKEVNSKVCSKLYNTLNEEE